MFETDFSKNRKVVFIGFGAVAKAVLPLLFGNMKIDPSQAVIISSDEANKSIASEYNVKFIHTHLTPANYREALDSVVKANDVILNLSVQVCTFDLISYCQENEILYLDTSRETWVGSKDFESLTTYSRRKIALEQFSSIRKSKTALLYHGANPGLVSHLLKEALLKIAEREGINQIEPVTQNDWAILAKKLDVSVIHIAERDTQISSIARRPSEFCNTWSVYGFLEEAEELTGIAWGTHEETPPDHLKKKLIDDDSCRALEFNRAGRSLQVKSWVPSGIIYASIIPHPEAYSIAQYLALKNDDGKIVYQPTVHFAYRPCDDAINSMRDAALFADNLPNLKQRVLFDDIIEGEDELGVLILRANKKEIFWYGSRLDIQTARELAPHNNATSLQVAASVFAGFIWMLENPNRGIVEPEQIDHKRILEIARPYLGIVEGYCFDGLSSSPEPKWTFNSLSLDV
jgi:homospermidine synthase